MVPAKRQDITENTIPVIPGVPSCVTVCMARGNLDGCASYSDFACLCSKRAYQESVLNCWHITCNAKEVEIGISLSATACAAYGKVPDAVVTTGANSPIATNLTLPPIVYSRTAWNISAVMSSVCSVVLALAIIIGIVNCRNQAKREAQTNSRWTNITNLTESKARSMPSDSWTGGQTVSQLFRADGRLAGPLDSVDDDRFAMSHLSSIGSINRPHRFNGQKSFGEVGVRFTNRLPHHVMGEGEEWEMADRSGSDKNSDSDTIFGKGKERERDTDSSGLARVILHSVPYAHSEPPTPTTVHMVSECGSTANLRKVPGERE